jgi:hypothetical protein
MRATLPPTLPLFFWHRQHCMPDWQGQVAAPGRTRGFQLAAGVVSIAAFGAGRTALTPT